MDTILSRRGRALLARARTLLAGARAGLISDFGGTEPALCQMAAVIAALAAGCALAALYWPHPAGYFLLCGGSLALFDLGLWLARRLLRRFLGHSLGWLMALALLAGSVAETVRRGAGEGWSGRVWIFSASVTAALWVFAASWWSLAVRRRLVPATATAAALSTAAVGALAVFLLGGGFAGSDIGRYLELSARPDAAQAALEPSLGPGPHAVAVLDYGPGTDLEGGHVNLTAYMSRDTGTLTGRYVDAYLDYDLRAVPLAGRVWYPADGLGCPVLFIAHGNHEITTPSYLGYAYLGEYLASHGYVVVSVDENACNLLTGENDGRAVLLLEHIGLLLEYNKEQGNPLYGKMDPDNLAIAGHSRGGEMVAAAYLFNGYSRYPENGTVSFDYHYSIRSLIAIAPTVDQYKPAGHSVELEDVNYLLLHGAADRDVSDFMGMAQYENLSFSGRGRYLKTALYIAGANHGQFNSLWGAFDEHGPHTPLLNTDSLLSQADQQRIARLFIKVFLDVTLRGDDSCAGLLTDWDCYAGQLPGTAYYQCWESSAFTPIAGFEEDSDLETATMEGASCKAGGVNWWTEERMDFTGKSAGGAHALHLRWLGTGTYQLSFPELDFTDRMLSFDLCDLDSGALERGDYALLDGTVRLTDAEGGTAEAAIGSFATVFPILRVRTDKLDFLFNTCEYKKAMATVAIPAGAFAPGDTGFDASRVVGLAFVFDGAGEVAMDHIGLETAGPFPAG